MNNLSFIDNHCTNCAVRFSSASQIFTTITVVDETNSSNILDIEILDAILYIYGFSATNLASAYLDDGRAEILSTFSQVSETSEYIIKHGLSLCSTCVSVFKEVYVAYHQLKKLSTETSLLTKAIKKFSPTGIKIEVDPENEWTIQNSEGENLTRRATNTVHLRQISPDISTATVENPTDDLFQAFNFEQDEDNYDNDQDDLKMDPLAEPELTNVFVLVPSCNLLSDTPNNVTSNDVIVSTRYQRMPSNVENHGSSWEIATPINKTKYTPEKSVDKNIGQPKKSDTKTPPVAIGSQRPYSLNRIHLTRRAASLLSNSVKNDEATRSEIVNESKETEKHETLPKRSLSEEQKEKARLNLKACMKRRKKIGKKVKKGWHWHKKMMQDTNNKLGEVPKVETTERYSKSFPGHKIYQHQEKDKHASQNRPGHKLYEQLKMVERTYQNEGRSNDERVAQVQPSPSFIGKKLDEREKILKCSCGRGFYSLTGLRRHEKNIEHQEQKEPLICDTCEETFKKSYLLYGHKIMEHSEFPQLLFKCDLCDMKYLLRQSLNTHKAQYHSTVPNSFTCDKCGKHFNCMKYFRKHVRGIHKDDGLDKELFKCKECGIFLKHSQGLKKHTRIMHGTQKTFICHKCGKTTKNMTNMRIHMKVHDPDRNVKRKPPPSTMEEGTN